MNFRTYNPKKDKEAAHRIWYEIGWLDDKNDEAAMDIYLSGGRVLVADLNGEAECLVVSMPGSIRHLQTDLSFSAVAGVTTSRIARRQGLAARLTAKLIADDAAEGALVSGLGMFEQGFYNRLGFGTGCYEHWLHFDPTKLTASRRARVPRRLTKDDWALVHAGMLNRQRGHGAVNLLPEQSTEGELKWQSNGFGLGYCDGPNEELTHFFWGRLKGEQGPLRVNMMAFQAWDQFLELMALIKSLGDQVHSVGMREPAGIQLQDLLTEPFKNRNLTRKSDHENNCWANAYWQIRICDLSGCLEKTHLANELRFNLNLSDPIEEFLTQDALWQGVAGQYVVTLGPSSGVEAGTNTELPTLTASVGAFSRLWLGVLPASSLAVTDDLSAPFDLLRALDQMFRLPRPSLGWEI